MDISFFVTYSVSVGVNMFKDILPRLFSHLTGIESIEMASIPEKATLVNSRTWTFNGGEFKFDLYKETMEVVTFRFGKRRSKSITGFYVTCDLPDIEHPVVQYKSMKLLFLNKYLSEMHVIWISRLLTSLYMQELKSRLLRHQS